MSRALRVIVVLAMVSFVACSTSTSPAPPPRGTVFFRMDQASCKYSGAKQVTFYISTDEAGTESMLGDGTSAGYHTKASSTYAKPGNPLVQARIANYTATGGALWTARVPIKVLADAEVTHTVVC